VSFQCHGLKQQYLLCSKRATLPARTKYRGIAVGNVLGKVFSMVLDQWVSQWAEDDNGQRAQAQAGFRKQGHENHRSAVHPKTRS